MSLHVLSVMVNNNAGVLSRVSGLFSRRGYNIDSLSVGETENQEISRMTIVVNGDDYILEQIKKQLAKLVEVKRIDEMSAENAVMREHILVKIASDVQNRTAILEVANIFRANIISATRECLTLELTGDPSKINAFIELISSFTIMELVRTGLTALGK